jgi:hypothetical protein
MPALNRRTKQEGTWRNCTQRGDLCGPPQNDVWWPNESLNDRGTLVRGGAAGGRKSETRPHKPRRSGQGAQAARNLAEPEQADGRAERRRAQRCASSEGCDHALYNGTPGGRYRRRRTRSILVVFFWFSSAPGRSGNGQVGEGAPEPPKAGGRGGTGTTGMGRQARA